LLCEIVLCVRGREAVIIGRRFGITFWWRLCLSLSLSLSLSLFLSLPISLSLSIPLHHLLLLPSESGPLRLLMDLGWRYSRSGLRDLKFKHMGVTHSKIHIARLWCWFASWHFTMGCKQTFFWHVWCYNEAVKKKEKRRYKMKTCCKLLRELGNTYNECKTLLASPQTHYSFCFPLSPALLADLWCCFCTTSQCCHLSAEKSFTRYPRSSLYTVVVGFFFISWLPWVRQRLFQQPPPSNREMGEVNSRHRYVAVCVCVCVCG
jgi:hypothetical protein